MTVNAQRTIHPKRFLGAPTNWETSFTEIFLKGIKNSVVSQKHKIVFQHQIFHVHLYTEV